MLGHTFVQWLFGFTNIYVFAFLTALDHIHQVAFLGVWRTVFGVYQFLSDHVGGFEKYRNVVLIVNLPEFLRYPRHIRNDYVIALVFPFVHTHRVGVLTGACRCFHKGPTGIATGSKGLLRCLCSFSGA